MTVILMTYDKNKALKKVMIIFLMDKANTQIINSEEKMSNKEYEDNQKLFQDQDFSLSDHTEVECNSSTSTKYFF